MSWSLLKKAISNPAIALNVGIALIKGWLFKAICVFNPRVSIGSNFRAYVWPKILGPGKVCIGDNVSIHLSFLRRPAILTHTTHSRVTIGNGTVLSGTRISCVVSVSIGNEALLGSSTIIDSDIIPHKEMTIDAGWAEEHAQPITIGNYVWTGVNSFILTGSVVKDECVLGAGAVIQYSDVPTRSLLVGNPARKIGVTRTL